MIIVARIIFYCSRKSYGLPSNHVNGIKNVTIIIYYRFLHSHGHRRVNRTECNDTRCGLHYKPHNVLHDDDDDDGSYVMLYILLI